MLTDSERPQTLDDADAALTGGGPEPDDVEVSETPAAEPAGESAQPRDDAGRFTAAPEAAPEASQEEPAPPADPGEPEADATGEEPAAEEPEEPVSYRADGQEFEIPGSAVGENGWFIPADQVPEVQQLLSSGRAAMGSVRERLSQAAQEAETARHEAAAAKAESQHVLAHFENLIERSQEALRQGTMDALVQSPLGQWFLGVAQGWPILKADAKTRAVEMASQTATRRLQEYEQRDQQARLRPLMADTVRSSVWQQGQAAGLDEQTLRSVEQMLTGEGYQRMLFVPAPYDDPAAGFRKGDLVIDHAVVAGALQLAGINRGTQVQQQRIAQAQRQNAQAAGTSRKVPPTVGAKGRSPAGPAIPQPKSAKEADAMLTEGDLSWAETLEG